MVRASFRAAMASAILVASACVSPVRDSPPPTSWHYQTGVRDGDISASLEDAFRSIMRLSTTAEFTTYFFQEDAGVTDVELLSDDLTIRQQALSRAVEVYSEAESKGGSAVVFSRRDRRVALITNDHVTTFPRVQIEYFDVPSRGQRTAPLRVASISFRESQFGQLTDYPELGPYQVLARDSINDLAVIEIELPWRRDLDQFRPIPTALGDPTRLRWGSLLYVLGYPMGYPLATRAIVSDPNRDGVGGFLADGTWNEGISGGPILAVRERSGALEWVGLTRAAVGDYEVRLLPHPDHYLDEPGAARLYDGPLFTESVIRIKYGITLPIPMTTVRAFISLHRPTLEQRGYDVRRF